MKVALCQINSTLGNFDYNSSLILKFYERSKKLNADIVVFPELSITGYPPQDLLLNDNFINENLVAVMFGDGAIEEGCGLESLNLSSVFKLPILFIIEDNGLAIHTKKNVRSSLNNYIDLAKTFNIKTFSGTFKDPQYLYKTFQEA